jgi:NAD(P)-dependent dehydrogenase (short-subunit alcohol dehydrogenase family)
MNQIETKSLTLSVVTGAAGNLGQAICTRLLKHGHQVLAVLRPGGTRLDRNLASSTPIISVDLDLANLPTLERIKTTLELSVPLYQFEEINILHPAGVFYKEKLPCSEEHWTTWQTMFNTHCASLYGLVNALLPQWTRIRQGSIIGISSNLVHRVNTGTAGYVASKAALEAMLKQLAYELGPLNIRCNCIAPGYFPSTMSRQVDQQKQTAIIENTPLRRIATVEDIGDAVLLLLSDKARWITGQTLVVDGGNTLGF